MDEPFKIINDNCLNAMGSMGNSTIDAIVTDPFMGSGSTGVACVQEGMRFVGIDMEEHYCDIARKRISNEPLTVFNEL